MEYLIIGGLLVLVLILVVMALYQTGAKIHWRIRARVAENKIAATADAVERLYAKCRELGIFVDEPQPTCSTEWPEVLEERKD